MILKTIERFMENAAETIQSNFETIVQYFVVKKYTLTLKSGFRGYTDADGLFIWRFGKVCFLAGVISNTSAIESGAGVEICNPVPEECTPPHVTKNLCQASSVNTFLVNVYGPGDSRVVINRHANGSGNTQINVGAWLNIFAFWVCE